jgi:peptide/nickel transport system ATP-binding protein
MHKGQVVETGDAEQICIRPRERYTQRLIPEVPSPDPRRKRMLYRLRAGGRIEPPAVAAGSGAGG